MKRLLALLLAVVMLLGLTACKKSDGTTLAELKEAGALKVAVTPDCSPYVKVAEDGTLSGIELDLLAKVCKTLEVKLEAELVTREEALAGVEDGTYHLAAGMLTSKTNTQEALQYTNAYAVAPQMVICKLGGRFEKLSDLGVKKLAVKAGSYAESMSEEGNFTYTPYATYAECMTALETDAVTAILLDRWVAEELMAGKPQAQVNGDLVLLTSIMGGGYHAFAMAPGSDEVIYEINKAVSTMAAEEEMTNIFIHYGATYTSPY